MIVVDASVFNKLFLDEPDRPQAAALFRHAIEYGIALIAPSLLLYEALPVALHYDVSFRRVHELLDAQRSAGMQLVEPSLPVLERAWEIARHGSKATGHPSLQDSIYHALAIETGATLVTADQRHFRKTNHFGYIQLLEDWREK